MTAASGMKKAFYRITNTHDCFYVRLCRPELAVTAGSYPATGCVDCGSRMNGQCRHLGTFLVSRYDSSDVAFEAAKALIQELKRKEVVQDGKS